MRQESMSVTRLSLLLVSEGLQVGWGLHSPPLPVLVPDVADIARGYHTHNCADCKHRAGLLCACIALQLCLGIRGRIAHE